MKEIAMNKKTRKSSVEKFIALPDSRKERIVKQLERETLRQSIERSRPLGTKERRQWGRFKAKMGRPKIGKGAKTISLTMEKDLLKQADTYARRHGISRAKLVAQGIQAILGSAA
jgi:hypothetical protein